MKKLFPLFVFALVNFLPVVTFADQYDTNGGGVTLPNPLAGGVDSIRGLVEFVLNNIVLPVGAIVVVLYIIYAGFLFVTARGSESKLEDAKSTLYHAIIGTAILLGATAISIAISNTLCQIAPNLPQCH